MELTLADIKVAIVVFLTIIWALNIIYVFAEAYLYVKACKKELTNNHIL